MTAPPSTSHSWSGSLPRPWRLTRDTYGFLLEQNGPARQLEHDRDSITIRRRWFKRSIDVDLSGDVVTLRPLNKQDAKHLAVQLHLIRTRRSVNADLASVVRWHGQVREVLGDAITIGRWIPEESIAALEAARPRLASAALAAGQLDAQITTTLTEAETSALAAFRADLRQWVKQVNEQVISNESITRRQFLDTIESSPLTTEQARAVLCFDNRVQVVASAGSGKTSVMVARAAYAIDRGFVDPSRILLLAFNKNAAQELQERIETRLHAAGIPSAGVRASTFHAFGLSTIGQATGRKPRLAPWLEGGGDVRMVNRIVDELRDSSMEFRYSWDLFRRLYAPLGENETDDEPDGWDKQSRTTGYRTANGEVVKSHGERLIADFLYLNHVEYRYEHPYSVDVATAEHSQYRPDFYYPTADIWHEHWAVDAQGRVPSEFVGYADSMRWKKALHRSQGTTLLETTWGEIQNPATLERLASELRSSGIELNWDPDRHSQGPAPVRHEDLARLMRTFMAHVKSNGLTRESIESRVASARPGLQRSRTTIFLSLYWQIHDAWERKLAEEEAVDFEDMLVAAAAHLASGRATQDYDLVLVDEFQDASQARARLVASLVDKPNAFLLTVGDDWQAINRFAGADISVMSRFDTWFGPSQQFKLETTFRCSAQICAVSSSFVSKNPSQLPKTVRAHDQTPRARAKVISVPRRESIPEVISSTLRELDRAVAAGKVRPRPGKCFSVFILGRYGFDKDFAPDESHSNLDVQFKTIHGSKGLEADHVIIPNLTRGTYGFPSSITDDAVLELAMPQPEEYPHAEERRLLYVALTRARLGATLITVAGSESPFVAEMIEDQSVDVDASRVPTPAVVCPVCRQGTLVSRTGPYGSFLGCTSFPKCRHTQQVS